MSFRWQRMITKEDQVKITAMFNLTTTIIMMTNQDDMDLFPTETASNNKMWLSLLLIHQENSPAVAFKNTFPQLCRVYGWNT